MPQFTQHAEWDHRLADDFGRQFAQLVVGSSQAAQLLTEHFDRKRMFLRLG